jgi:hypothetical protein
MKKYSLHKGRRMGGINKKEILLNFLIQEIALAKKIRAPLFEEDDLKGHKQIEQITQTILTTSERAQIEPLFLTTLFVRYAFPLKYHHTALRSIKTAWNRFKENHFDDECLQLSTMFKNGVTLTRVNHDLKIFFTNWNALQKKMQNTQKFTLERSTDMEFFTYKIALKVYFFVRPVVLAHVGDIILEETTLLRFLTMATETGMIQRDNIRLYYLVKRDPVSTEYFAERIIKVYSQQFQYDPVLSNVGAAPAKPRQRDEEAIKKIEELRRKRV